MLVVPSPKSHMKVLQPSLLVLINCALFIYLSTVNCACKSPSSGVLTCSEPERDVMAGCVPSARVRLDSLMERL